jgi:two-component system, LuxR family, sensor kinase FixL
MGADISGELRRPASSDEAASYATDRRLLYEVIDQNRLAGIDAVGAALSHELNQPLTALVIYLQTLQRRTAASGMTAGGQIHEMAEKALREAERATDIVRRMRRLSLRAEPDRQPIDINALASETIDNALIGVPSHPIIERDFAKDLPVVMGDPVQIRQVMVNLIKNAAEATQQVDMPRISVSTTREDGDGLHHGPR